jgi:hypothetical protein
MKGRKTQELTMARLMSRLSPLLPLLLWLPAFAADEVPAEKASPVVVVAFLILLVGSCAAYGIYLIMANKGKPEKDE